jgi:cellulose synthase/poly-beta-1,6-N-acetylglucosamine synthase-like glycosyltransferase
MIQAEKVACLLFMALALFVGFESRHYPLGAIDNPGPGFLPLLLAVAMAVLAVTLAVKVWTKGAAPASHPFWPEKGGLSKVSLAFAAILLFTVLLEITGYIFNIFLFFIILLKPIGRQKWSWSVAISLGATLVAYLLFDKWLMIPLPRGIWFGGN